jgi:hypothetical protein
MIPFSLQEALAGAEVQQRNGMFARIVRQEGQELIVELDVLSEEDDGSVNVAEIVTTVHLDGVCKPEMGETECDLFMATKQ